MGITVLSLFLNTEDFSPCANISQILCYSRVLDSLHYSFTELHIDENLAWVPSNSWRQGITNPSNIFKTRKRKLWGGQEYFNILLSELSTNIIHFENKLSSQIKNCQISYLNFYRMLSSKKTQRYINST